MDLSERVSAFVDEGQRDGPAEPDSLPQLARTHDAFTKLYGELAAHPERALAAGPLLRELSDEYDRLLRQVGRECLSRARAVPQPEAESPVTARTGVVASAAAGPSTPPVSEDDLREWAARYRERPPGPPPVSVAVLLHALLDRVGPPPEEFGTEARELEIDRLEQGTSESTLRELRQLPNEVQRSYLRLLTARLNAARAVVGGEILSRERVGRLLGIIRDYTREHRPGAVYGLSRDHEPKGGTWEADAAHLWHRLSHDDDGPISRNNPVTRSVRRAVDAEGDDGEERESPGPEPEWPFWPFVRDRTVLMVGGAPRESARARVERAFSIRELVWSPDDPRKAQNAEARIASGGYDLVLVLLRFMSHATNEKLVHACATRGVPYVPVEHGYGVASIRRSLEHFLAPRAAEATAK